MVNFSQEEKKAIAGLSVVLGLRMLGLSMIIPVFSLYALHMAGSSSLLAGLAFGIYGFTQALLQIPFGYFSDKLGRKRVVSFGLILFILGSVICATTTNIYVLIAGRALQGGGAIASACFAWVADHADPSRRSTAMAFMGIAVGGGIVTGMIVGPIIAGANGVVFLFWLAAILSVLALLITMFILVEQRKTAAQEADFNTLDPRRILHLAGKPDLIKLNIVGFVVNMAMISTFFIIPQRLKVFYDIGELWKVYLPLSLMGGVAMMFTARRADAGGARKVIIGALLTMCAAYLILISGSSLVYLYTGFAFFFTGFSVLEATLPSSVSKLADPAHKGTIMGVYNFSQFIG
ncbi:MAG: MFS transporter, partial [Nitrospinota bacterium]|nr:MFS transporter [Nitrospinota bacterium]